jgi:hypothetical protein
MLTSKVPMTKEPNNKAMSDTKKDLPQSKKKRNHRCKCERCQRGRQGSLTLAVLEEWQKHLGFKRKAKLRL